MSKDKIEGIVIGITLTISFLGFAQWLISVGYAIATNLVGAGFTYTDLRAHKKIAIVMPWVMQAKTSGDSKR